MDVVKPVEASVPFMTRLRPEDAERVRRLAAQDDRPVSALIRRMVIQGLQRMEAS